LETSPEAILHLPFRHLTRPGQAAGGAIELCNVQRDKTSCANCNMMDFLLRAIFEMAASAVVEFLGMEDIVEIVTAFLGLGCMAIGLAIYLFGGWQ
jgi:hypothetical protein